MSTGLVQHLMDGVDPEVITDAVAAAMLVPDVTDAQARGRWSGRTLGGQRRFRWAEVRTRIANVSMPSR